ncbi:hypothetical protein [Lentibacillus sp. CBA3610]|uniref:hypothetical protein n=1 Tax=Lentibacillus sp. CBA3610 TaxID=2518176 RepID=UPI00159527C2|nr:hypothetical protein [Lentibacillus sp. CBA3610]QKY70632.1 hypothetical protein Len3610_14465 [Lentibacillus sp. CBA3610]
MAQDNTFEQQIKNFGEKQTNKVPEDYTPEEAMENGDITPTNITPKQREKINQFKKNAWNGNLTYSIYPIFQSLETHIY